mgnify:CR=1 FL=1
MKKRTNKNAMRIALFSMLVSVSLSLNAQDVGDMHYGGKGGLTFSSFAIDYEDFTDMKTAYAMGGYFTYQVHDMVAAGAEIYYLQHGAVNFPAALLYPYYPTASLPDYTNITLHSMDFQVLANIIPDAGGDMIPRFVVGGAYSVLMHARANNLRFHYDNGDYPIVAMKSYDNVTSTFKQYDFAAVAGAGFDMEMSDLLISLDVKYRFGLSCINENEFFEGMDFTGNTFMITVGVGL